ncbi:hypothetical protein BDW69DRAFT_203072 [Aspergillus filifer]
MRFEEPKAGMSQQSCHQIFGPTNHDWVLLSAYFTSYEELGVTVQREKWLRGESVRLKCILLDEMSRGEQRPDLVHAYADILHEWESHREACRDALYKWQATADGLRDTLIYRGICETRSEAFRWYLSAWYRRKCVEAGGCCARNRRCCLHYPDNDTGTWAGHCTPACPCCSVYNDIERPIEPLDSRGESERVEQGPRHRDQFSHAMWETFAWQY